GKNTQLTTKGLVLTSPVGAASMAVYLCSAHEYSTNALDVLAVTVHGLNFTTVGNNNRSNDYRCLHQLIQNEFCFEGALEIPNSTNIYAQFQKGDKVSLSPAAGGNYEYVCTQNGKPGTWKRYSVITS